MGCPGRDEGPAPAGEEVNRDALEAAGLSELQAHRVLPARREQDEKE